MYKNISRIKDLLPAIEDLLEGKCVKVHYDITNEAEKQVVTTLRRMYCAGCPEIDGLLYINDKLISFLTD